jgi:hypothetical protein
MAGRSCAVFPAHSRRCLPLISNVRPRIQPMPLLYAQIALLGLLPLTLSVVAAAYLWKGLAKPWLFLIVATAIGYLIYGLLMYFHNSDQGKRVGYMVSANEGATSAAEKYQVTTTGGDALHYFLQPYATRMVIFVVISLPLLWVLARVLRRSN